MLSRKIHLAHLSGEFMPSPQQKIGVRNSQKSPNCHGVGGVQGSLFRNQVVLGSLIMPTGRLKKFVAEKGFGFITPDDGAGLSVVSVRVEGGSRTRRVYFTLT